MQNGSLVTTQHGNVRFRISCVWISCLSRCMEAIDWRKLVAKWEFDNPMDNLARHESSAGQWNGRPFALCVLPNSMVFSSR